VLVKLQTSDRHENKNHEVTFLNSSSDYSFHGPDRNEITPEINSETVASKLCVSRDLASSTIKGLEKT